MGQNDVRQRFNWSEFLTGVLFIVASILVFRNPGATMLTLSLIFALVAVVRGIATIGGFFRVSAYTGGRPWILLIVGVLDLIVGLIFVFNLVTAATVLAYLFAFWFFFDSLGVLLSSGYLRSAGTGWFVLQLLLGILNLGLALLLLFSPVVSAIGLVALLAFILLSSGISAIVLTIAQWHL